MRTGAFDPANANIVPQDSQESGKKLCGYNSQWIDKQKFINSFLPSINSVNLVGQLEKKIGSKVY